MIAEQELFDVAEFVKTNGLSEAVIAELRTKFPGKHFTWCMEDDIHSGKPVYEGEGFDIYVVNSMDHCSVLTNDLESASGFVLAELIEE
ncbi:DUF6129 family protein [Teredinibacter turnerae]|uniref:DUF6129 domain-containing protein n=1 Tax=Teredinibacter turnerae (strain ATCC 39867 / T7901) TaxID=377629 RepID=C5BTB5_TERTT|nr:DUF6129 family protein [Teredinibacter turnerae]ACR12987.1 conserved hypothetical protein [Teredinibacter turnerae T7901]